jgi:hypothetical protein
MFVCCVLCAFNTLVFPTFQRSFQLAGQVGTYAIDSSLLEILVGTLSLANGVTDQGADDWAENSEFLSTSSTSLHFPFDLDCSRNKIPVQDLLLDPFLEKSTPPPESLA